MVTNTRTSLGSKGQTNDDAGDEYAVDRLEVFRRTSDKYGFGGEYLWGVDRYPTKQLHWNLERSIKNRITARVCDRPWDAIVTHGDDGEFGHPQHRAVHEAVVESVYHCCNSTARLMLFQPEEPDAILPSSGAAGGAATDDELSAGQKDRYKLAMRETEKKMFGNWTNNVVAYKEFDYDLAGRICRAYRKPGRKYKSMCRGDGYVTDSSDDLFRRKRKFRHKGHC